MKLFGLTIKKYDKLPTGVAYRTIKTTDGQTTITAKVKTDDDSIYIVDVKKEAKP